MKFYFVIVLGLMTPFLNAQCNCGSGSLSLSGTDAGFSDNAGFSSEFISDTRFFRNKIIRKSDADTVTELRQTDLLSLNLKYIFKSGFMVHVYGSFLQAYGRPITEKGITDLPVLIGKQVRLNSGNSIYLSAGVELPTGKISDISKQQSLVVKGSGNYDPILQAGYSYTKNKVNLKLSSLNKLTTSNHNRDNLGSMYTQQVWFLYRVKGIQSCIAGDSVQLQSVYSAHIIGGISNEIYGMQRIKNTLNYQSGGTLTFVSAGAIIQFNHFDLSLVGYLPIYQYWKNTNSSFITSRIRLSLTIKL